MIAEDGDGHHKDGKAKAILRAWIEKKGSGSDHSIVNEPTVWGYFYQEERVLKYCLLYKIKPNRNIYTTVSIF